MKTITITTIIIVAASILSGQTRDKAEDKAAAAVIDTETQPRVRALADAMTRLRLRSLCSWDDKECLAKELEAADKGYLAARQFLAISPIILESVKYRDLSQQEIDRFTKNVQQQIAIAKLAIWYRETLVSFVKSSTKEVADERLRPLFTAKLDLLKSLPAEWRPPEEK